MYSKKPRRPDNRPTSRWRHVRHGALLLAIWVALTELLLRVFAANYMADRYRCCTGDPALCLIGLAHQMNTQFPELTTDPHRIFRHDPVLGHRLMPNLSNVLYKGGLVSTNDHGVRGHAPHPYERVDGRRRFVVVGDSYTMGQEVNDQQTWAAVLESLDPTREVINLGTSAYGIDQATLMMREEGLRYRPDVVLFGYFRDDLYRDMSAFACSSKPQFVERGDRLVLEGVPVPSPEALRSRIRRTPFLWQFWRYFRDHPHKAEPTIDASNALGHRILSLAAEMSQTRGARLVLVHLPDVFAFMHEPEWRDPFFTRACTIPGVVCVDPLPRMRAELARTGRSAHEAFFRIHHYNPHGNQVVAEAVDAWLRENPASAHGPP